MQTWKDEVVSKLTGGVRTLLKANGCDYRQGIGQADRAATPSRWRARAPTPARSSSSRPANIVLATGSRPIEIPGFKFDGKRIVDSTGALAFREVPGRLLVIGGGYIGLEIGTLYAKLGTKVTVVEALPGILPGTDPELAQVVARKLKKMGVEVLTGAKAKSLDRQGRPRRRHRRDRRRRGHTSTPTRCWSPSAAAPTPRTWAWRRWA